MNCFDGLSLMMHFKLKMTWENFKAKIGYSSDANVLLKESRGETSTVA